MEHFVCQKLQLKVVGNLNMSILFILDIKLSKSQVGVRGQNGVVVIHGHSMECSSGQDYVKEEMHVKG